MRKSIAAHDITHDQNCKGVGHIGEHLGQEIAYARSNKVTPPWSKAEK